MREFTLVEFKTNEAIAIQNNPIEVHLAGVILNEVSESHGQYTVPAVRIARETEVEYTF